MKKHENISIRTHLWTAGILILLGTMLITFTSIVHTNWWNLNPLPSNWIVESDQYYHGVLSVSNASTDIEISFFTSPSAIELSEIYTNSTPITITIHSLSNGILFQLVNLSTPQDYGLPLVEVITEVDIHESCTVTVQRVTTDVLFEFRLIWKSQILYTPAPRPDHFFIAFYILGGICITTGFFLIERTIRHFYKEHNTNYSSKF
ncbi:MAG: hypothetical protein ACFFCH_11730 [Promethearchaeota archaeon]